jgi:toxin ParE1/3/4
MKTFKVLWTNLASFDLENIIEYIKIDSISNAKKVFFDIKKECDKLYYFPERKKIVPELQSIGIKKYREVIYKRWRIIYKIENKSVYILAVIDSSRNFEDKLFQRLLND